MDEIACECTSDSRDNPLGPEWYLEEERKAFRHGPEGCPGDFDLALFRRVGGTEAWLCSCCWLEGKDERLSA